MPFVRIQIVKQAIAADPAGKSGHFRKGYGGDRRSDWVAAE